jgi:hypothetical protein
LRECGGTMAAIGVHRKLASVAFPFMIISSNY